MNLERLSQLNTDDFTIEDVMAIFGWWRWWAKLIMATGVRRGEFTEVDGHYRLKGKAR